MSATIAYRAVGGPTVSYEKKGSLQKRTENRAKTVQFENGSRTSRVTQTAQNYGHKTIIHFGPVLVIWISDHFGLLYGVDPEPLSICTQKFQNDTCI